MLYVINWKWEITKRGVGLGECAGMPVPQCLKGKEVTNVVTPLSVTLRKGEL